MKKISKLLIDYHFFLIIVTILLFPFMQLPISGSPYSNEVSVTNESELRAAINQSGITIIVNDVIDLSHRIEIENDITIGGEGTITVTNVDSDFINHHFIIRESGSLTLMGDVTLTRREEYIYGGGVFIDGGIFIMHGGSIVDNDWLISPESQTTRNIPSIHVPGGGVHVSNGGIFYLYDGLIAHNRAIYGGGVRIAGSQSRFIMHGGYIQYNHARIGGGIYNSGIFVTSTPQNMGISMSPAPRMNAFYMHDGMINDNTAQLVGGGIYFGGSSFANLYGGQIINNEASAHGGVYTTTNAVNVQSRMRVIDNYPPNFYEVPNYHLILNWIITPTIYRLAAVFAIAIVGVILEIQRKKQNRQVSFSS